MINRKFIIPAFILFFFAGHSAFAADSMVDPREAAIDRAIGGMIEGSRPLLPQNDAGKNQVHKIPGANLSPGMDAKVTASASTQGPSNSNGIGSSVGHAGGTSGGTLEGGANVGTETGGTTTPETGSTSGGSTNNSIVNVDANVDLSGESPVVDANLAVDTNADTLLDANTSTTTEVTSADATVTESGTVAGEDLTTTVNEAPLDATLDSEIVATDIPTDSEATTGLEADVDPVTADSDVTSTDPADGLVI